MRNLLLTLAYDGTPFFGWQMTKEGPSIEEALSSALTTILREPISLQAASRTDRGVHARCQKVNFFTKNPIALKNLSHRLNLLLPKEIALLHIEEKEEKFHATLDTLWKEYHYEISLIQDPSSRYFSWYYPYPIDLPLLQKEASSLLGKHDFSAFSSDRKNPICTLFRLTAHFDFNLRLEMRGDRFLYKMARRLAGTLLKRASHKQPLSLLAILKSKDPKKTFTAPAKGLFLHEVAYDFPK